MSIEAVRTALSMSVYSLRESRRARPVSSLIQPSYQAVPLLDSIFISLLFTQSIVRYDASGTALGCELWRRHRPSRSILPQSDFAHTFEALLRSAFGVHTLGLRCTYRGAYRLLSAFAGYHREGQVTKVSSVIQRLGVRSSGCDFYTCLCLRL